MPEPKANETEREFLARCIPLLIDEGREVKQAAAICYQMFDSKAKEMTTEPEEPEVDETEKADIEKSMSGFSVFKADGVYRWLSISSNAYEDKEEQVVSQKALENSVAFNDARDYRGPLRWWHVGDTDKENLKAGPGLDIGDCDFSMMRGKFLVESGTFRDDKYAHAAKEYDGRISIRFFHPKNEPDKHGVFNTIVHFERSLLPSGKESNPFTAFTVAKELTPMTDKAKEFVKMLGDEKFANSVLSEIDSREKALDGEGVRSKEDSSLLDKIKSLINGPEEVADKPKEDPMVAETMDMEAMSALITDAVVAGMSKVLEGLNAKAEKTDLEEDTEKAMQEAQVNLSKRIEKLETELDSSKKELEEILGKPGYRATQDEDNIIDKSKQTELTPAAVGLNDFVQRSTMGAGGQS